MIVLTYTIDGRTYRRGYSRSLYLLAVHVARTFKADGIPFTLTRSR